MASNPYSPPKAAVADINSATEFQSVKLWSAEGRIGRLRYLAHSMVFFFAFAAIAGVAFAIGGMGLGMVVVGIGYIALIVFNVFKTIQRSHDMGWNGWTCLISFFVPFAAFVWLFKAGTPGDNEYGAPPEPNTTAVKVIGIGAIAVIPIMGILAAIAIPQYQKYLERAKAAEYSEQMPADSEEELALPEGMEEGAVEAESSEGGETAAEPVPSPAP